jgi:two-component system, OmpR family, response regulator
VRTASRQTPSSPARLLIVEDDDETASLLAELFADEGYEVEIAGDGQRGLHLALTSEHQVMVIDRGLPGIDGLELIGKLRRVGVSARILVLTALGHVTERIRGLDGGADDYLPKPFEVGELLARVRALQRRHREDAELLPLGTAVLDLNRREVALAAGTSVPLSGREFELLRLLATNPRTIYRRSDLRARLFADTSAESIVDTYVYHLRRKLGRDVVRTVYGLGYQMGAA